MKKRYGKGGDIFFTPPSQTTPERRYYERVLVHYVNECMVADKYPDLKNKCGYWELILDQARWDIWCKSCQFTGMKNPFEYFNPLHSEHKLPCPDCHGFGIDLKHILPQDRSMLAEFHHRVYDRKTLDIQIYGHELDRPDRYANSHNWTPINQV